MEQYSTLRAADWMLWDESGLRDASETQQYALEKVRISLISREILFLVAKVFPHVRSLKCQEMVGIAEDLNRNNDAIALTTLERLQTPKVISPTSLPFFAELLCANPRLQWLHWPVTEYMNVIVPILPVGLRVLKIGWRLLAADLRAILDRCPDLERVDFMPKFLNDKKESTVCFPELREIFLSHPGIVWRVRLLTSAFITIRRDLQGLYKLHGERIITTL